MSKIQDRIKEIDKSAKRSRLIAILLSLIIIGFIIYTGYLLNQLSKTNNELTKSEKSLTDSKIVLQEKNKKLLELRGSLKKEWDRANASGQLKDYASYLERAIEDDLHYAEALQKMNTLANTKGYVQITDSDGLKYLDKIENLNTDDIFYRVIKDMNVRNGVLGHPDFKNKNTSRNGDIINIGNVVKIIQVYSFNSGAEWAEIKYDN